MNLPFLFITWAHIIIWAWRCTVGVLISFIIGTGDMPVPPPAPSKVSISILASEAAFMVKATTSGR